MSELPEGWVEIPLMEMSSLIRGVSYKKGQETNEPSEGYIPLIRANNIQNTIQFEGLKYVPSNLVSSEKLLQEGDVVIALSSGSKKVVGKAASLSKSCLGTFGAFCGVLRPTEKMNEKYFGYFFQTRDYRDFISRKSSGVNINNLKLQYFKEIGFPLPPLAEQHRIVAAIEALFARLDAAEARLERVPGILKQFRQAVLTAACDGRLTEEWRDERMDIKDSSVLLDQIKRSHETNGKGYGGKAASPTEGIHNLVSSDFPNSWQLESLKLLCKPGRSITYGILKPGPDQIDGIPYIRVADFPNDKIILDRIKRTTIEIANNYKRSSLNSGDVLLSIRGTVGRVSTVPPELEGANITQDTARISVHNDILADYVEWHLRCPSIQKRLEKATKGVAIRGVNIGDVRALQIAIPPLLEQHEIVSRVGALFALADQIEGHLAAIKERSDKLRQSILAQAFSGQLVPTEAELARREGQEYEQAVMLLDQIKVETRR
ncbi:MAG: restriction endonuclease subunit S [Methanomicrobiaceae archaeon]|nr:restriction endonuclease subunit S [Methanomicrobiaceae archaeon]